MSERQTARDAVKPSRSADDPCNATITHWSDCGEYHAIFRVTPDDGHTPAFEPGQYATLAMPREQPPLTKGEDYPPGDPRRKKLWRRSYSIASAAHERDHLEFYVAHGEKGRLTPRIWYCKLGARVWLDSRIRGDFTLEAAPPGKNLIMVATGTGLAPYVSMLRTYRGLDRWRRFVILHGVRLAADLGYREELESIAAADESVIYVPTCSREPDDTPWTGARGRVTALLKRKAFEKTFGFPLDPQSCHVFLCGNPAMIKDAERRLLKKGFARHKKKKPGNLHHEEYW